MTRKNLVFGFCNFTSFRELLKIEDFEVDFFFNESKNFRSVLEWNT